MKRRTQKPLSERDRQIIDLTLTGISAKKIKERLNLGITVRSIQRVREKRLGKKRSPNTEVKFVSKYNQIDPRIRPHVEYCLEQLGKNPYVCEICEERQFRKCDIHHTKYENATIYDLQWVCRSCNLSFANTGLA